MKLLIYIITLILSLLLFLLSCNSSNNKDFTAMASEINPEKYSSIYSFVVKDIDGNDFSFNSLKGKKILIVNTASECGLTPQYQELQELYDTYKNLNFIIVGFPANNFGGQEPGSNEQIKNFCQKNYGVTFPMMQKISVKGSDQHPIYQYLTQKSKNGVYDSEVTWNFQKYLIGKSGYLEKVIPPATSPLSDEIQSWIKQ